MARGINKAILVGNLGQDPEVRYTGNGTAVCKLRLATTDVYKDREGQLVEKTEWHSVVAWSRLAEICGQYLRKGSKIYVEGSLQTRSWEGRDGNTRYTTEIRAKTLLMLDRNTNASQARQAPSTQNDHRPANSGPATTSPSASGTPWGESPQPTTETPAGSGSSWGESPQPSATTPAAPSTSWGQSPQPKPQTSDTTGQQSPTSDLQGDPLLDDLPF